MPTLPSSPRTHRSPGIARSSPSRPTSSSSKTRSLLCVLVTPLLICALTSCATVSSPARVSLQVYQPRILRLEARQVIATRDGTYVPQVDETWHSAAAFEQLEREVLNLNAALLQERNRP